MPKVEDVRALFEEFPTGEADAQLLDVKVNLGEVFAFNPETKTVGEVLGRIVRKNQWEVRLTCSKAIGDHPLQLGMGGSRLVDILNRIKSEAACVALWRPAVKTGTDTSASVFFCTKEELAKFKTDSTSVVVWTGELPPVSKAPAAEDK